MVLKVNPEDKKHPENEELRRKYSSYIQKDPYEYRHWILITNPNSLKKFMSKWL